MISLDANIIIYSLNNNSEFAKPSQKILEKAASEGAVVSTILYTEVLAVSNDKFISDIVMIENFLDGLLGVSYMPVSTEIAQMAAKLLRENAPALRIADAIHLATAVESGADEFWTNDYKLQKIKVPNTKIKLLRAATVDT